MQPTKWFLAILALVEMLELSNCQNLSCRGPIPHDFTTENDFTNSMCKYCLFTLYTPSSSFVWKDFNQLFSNWGIIANKDAFFPKMNITNNGSTVEYTLDFNELKSSKTDPKKDLILREFANDYYRKQFLKCCEDANRCCKRMLTTKARDSSCPMMWDGWDCWESVESGTLARQVCPDMSLALFFDEPPLKCVRGNGLKHCSANGQWIGRTDYSTECTILAHGVRLSLVKTTVVFQSISLVFLAIGMTLYVYYRLYRKFRVMLHFNFFISITLYSAMSIIYNVLITEAHVEANKNSINTSTFWCRTFTFFFKNFRMINYGWMLVEGIFFHQIVVFTFNEMSKYKKRILWATWLVPNIFTLSYAIAHHSVSDDPCWTDQIGAYEWLEITFPYLCFVINILLFLNMIRVIINKLVLNKRFYPHFARRGIKTALVLMPIFGAQYITHFVPVDPTETCDNSQLMLLYVQQIVEGLQGLLATVILCFLDKDVYTAIRKSIGVRLDPHSTGTSVQILTEDSKSNIS